MVKILSVAEKPSVAKELAKIISNNGHMVRVAGHSQYNQIFEINSCTFRGHNASMKITSVTGHMMESEFDARFKSWNSCQPVELFSAPIVKAVKKESENIEKTLVEQAKKCDVLLLWLDCDLEGENIGFEVMNVCLGANRRLDVWRARFSALIPRDIMRALQFPERPNEKFNDAVEARQEIDLRLGAAFTRFQTLRVQNKFDNLGTALVSYGPCQFPTLGFVVDRHLQIEAFKPESFWSIACEVEWPDIDEKNGKLNCSFSWDRGRLFDRFACIVLYEMCIDGQLAKVTKCEPRPTTRQRPTPLNTIELQKRASRFLRMGSEKTMHVAESLYQRGLLSYPRTETDFFKEGFELQPLLEEHRDHHQWGPFVTRLLDENKFEWPRPGGHDDQAHPPIHTTKCVDLTSLPDPDERAIYELVTMHFLACCAGDAKGSQTNVSIQIPAEGLHGELFSASGLMILERNWLDVYGKYEKWSAKKVPSFKGNGLASCYLCVFLDSTLNIVTFSSFSLSHQSSAPPYFPPPPFYPHLQSPLLLLCCSGGHPYTHQPNNDLWIHPCAPSHLGVGSHQ